MRITGVTETTSKSASTAGLLASPEAWLELAQVKGLDRLVVHPETVRPRLLGQFFEIQAGQQAPKGVVSPPYR